jgi:hypothetical protein
MLHALHVAVCMWLLPFAGQAKSSLARCCMGDRLLTCSPSPPTLHALIDPHAGRKEANGMPSVLRSHDLLLPFLTSAGRNMGQDSHIAPAVVCVSVGLVCIRVR